MVEEAPKEMTSSILKLPAVAAFGNPLLDILVTPKNEDLLKKYNLNIDGEMEICEKKMQELIADLPPESEQKISAGGSTQNTMRILQWLCDRTYKSSIGVYFGCIGNDSRGTLVKKLVEAAGVITRYAIHQTLPTGVCVSLISAASRSLVANIGAAGVYTLDDLKKCNLSLDTVRIIYIEGFFIIHSLDVVKEVVKQAQERNIIIAFNLSSVYLFKDYNAEICEMVGLAKIVFGNAREMAALTQALNVEYEDVADIPLLLNNLKRISIGISSTNAYWLADDGTFVMTQGGSAPAIVVWGKGQSFQVQPITPIAPIVDTTGAGDSLAAGFLAGILAYWDPKRCLELGCKAASIMITEVGVTLPSKVPPGLLP